MDLGTVRWEAIPRKRLPKALKTKLAQGGPPGSSLLRSDDSRDARWEADHVNSGPGRSKGDLGNNSRKLGDLTINRHSDSLKQRVNLLLHETIETHRLRTYLIDILNRHTVPENITISSVSIRICTTIHILERCSPGFESGASPAHS
jgi:hypothetical protein